MEQKDGQHRRVAQALSDINEVLGDDLHQLGDSMRVASGRVLAPVTVGDAIKGFSSSNTKGGCVGVREGGDALGTEGGARAHVGDAKQRAHLGDVWRCDVLVSGARSPFRLLGDAGRRPGTLGSNVLEASNALARPRLLPRDEE
ncbi:unnamed protein product [Ilex paraguariensis]|uniref:Uncharacterized protein n=1 Tax=Ilex paraguariensis TaxID=185542 RepID=A0ABC8USY8_9AQUA